MGYDLGIINLKIKHFLSFWIYWTKDIKLLLSQSLQLHDRKLKIHGEINIYSFKYGLWKIFLSEDKMCG